MEYCSFQTLFAYLLGIPILGYSLDIGKENVNLIDERLEKLIYSGQLDAKELDRYTCLKFQGCRFLCRVYDCKKINVISFFYYTLFEYKLYWKFVLITTKAPTEIAEKAMVEITIHNKGHLIWIV